MLKKAVQQGRRRVETGGVVFLTHPPPSCQDSSFAQVGYDEDFDELKRRLVKGASWRTGVGRVKTETFSAFR
jgi:hypothetical protein